MSLIDLAERGVLPDSLIRIGIRRLCRLRLVEESGQGAEDRYARFWRLLEELRTSAIAIETDAANEQHYELPPGFFQLALGEHLKYSSCYYPQGTETLDQAEAAMLRLTVEHAALENGQDILELGCGWGSLTLWMASHYPDSRITAVSNSAPQREFILQQAADRGLGNVNVITADVNHFEAPDQYDRVVSVEMFEHMRNYGQLLTRVHDWLRPGGKLFVHIFCHRELMYPFEVEGEDNWMGRYFFTGGLMPAADTLLYFQDQLKLEEKWLLSGTHYQRTSEHWLQNMDRKRDQILPVLEETYGKDQAACWFQRWRMFFMSCAELFGFDDGKEWLVAHYRFQRPASNGHG